MKTKLLFTLSCLFLFSVIGHSQPAALLPPNFAEMRQSPMFQRQMEMGLKNAVRSFWEGRGTNLVAFGLLQDAEIRTALDVTDEQFQQIQSIPMTVYGSLRENPEFQEIVKEMQALNMQGDPFTQDLDKETMDQFATIQGRITALSMNTMSDAIGNALTPEQQQKMQEAQLATMGEMPIVSPSMFEILNLTDAQKEQMEGIKKELEPEFEKNLKDFSSGQMIVANKLFDELEKQGALNINMQERDVNAAMANAKAMQEKAVEATKKLMAEDPEFKRIQDETNANAKAFASQFQVKMFDVLTDEQWKRLLELTDNPSALAKVLLKKAKEQRGESEAGVAGWQPSADSWKPGDPVPEQYRQERNTKSRFPRTEN